MRKGNFRLKKEKRGRAIDYPGRGERGGGGEERVRVAARRSRRERERVRE